MGGRRFTILRSNSNTKQREIDNAEKSQQSSQNGSPETKDRRRRPRDLDADLVSPMKSPRMQRQSSQSENGEPRKERRGRPKANHNLNSETVNISQNNPESEQDLQEEHDDADSIE